VGNVSTNVCAKFRCAPLLIKKALGIFGPLEGTDSKNKKRLFGIRLAGPKMKQLGKIIYVFHSRKSIYVVG